MNESLRHLQIFRNGTIITGKTLSEIKLAVTAALADGSLTVKDGEPITIRYKENDDVKCINGIGYVNDSIKQIIWNDTSISIDTNPKKGDYVTLTHTEDGNGNVQLTVSQRTASIGDAKSDGKIIYINPLTGDEKTTDEYGQLDDDEKNQYQSYNTTDGLATAVDVKEYVDKMFNGVPTYSIVKLDTAENGFLATYQLQKNTSDGKNEVCGNNINIPKDFLVKSATITTCEENGKPESGFSKGDKYLDFVINTKDGNGTDEHIYLNVKDLTDVYTAGNGITIGDDNQIAVKVKSDTDDYKNYIKIDADGLYTDGIDQAIATAIKGLGEQNVTQGNYITGIKVNDNGKLSISQATFPDTSSIKSGKLVRIGAASESDVFTENTVYYTKAENGTIVEHTVRADDQPIDRAEAYVQVNDGGTLYIEFTKADGSHIYVDVNELANGTDTYIKEGSFTIPTDGENKDKRILTLTRSDNQLLTVDITNPDAIVETDDTHTKLTSTKGDLNAAGIKVIKEYIDNYDCGTFTLSLPQDN